MRELQRLQQILPFRRKGSHLESELLRAAPRLSKKKSKQKSLGNKDREGSETTGRNDMSRGGRSQEAKRILQLLKVEARC